MYSGGDTNKNVLGTCLDLLASGKYVQVSGLEDGRENNNVSNRKKAKSK